MALKVFFISPEVIPFANTYFISQFSKKIAIKFQNNPEIEIRLMHPKYGFISERKYILREVIRLKDFPVHFQGDEKLVSIKSAFIPESRVQIYFLEDDSYFKPVPELIYKARNGRVYKDNEEKFALFAKVALETLKQLLWIPDVIVCNDWQSSFIPYLFNEQYKNDVFFKKTRTIFVLHIPYIFNIGFLWRAVDPLPPSPLPASWEKLVDPDSKNMFFGLPSIQKACGNHLETIFEKQLFLIFSILGALFLDISLIF